MQFEPIECPFPPCGRTIVVHHPRTERHFPHSVVREHYVDSAAGPGDWRCPASGQSWPLHPTILKRLQQDEPRTPPQPEPVRERAPRIQDHSLTPHPTEDRQWFLTGPERQARGMASIEEVRAQLTNANFILEEGRLAAQQAAGKFAEAKAILGGVRQETSQELGLVPAGEALKACDDAFVYANAAIELNAQYASTL